MSRPHAKAEDHLAKCHPAFAQTIQRVGPCTLVPDPKHFALLCRCIISQQISTKAAASITAKLVAKLEHHGVTAASLLALADEDFRGCGISASKAKFLRSLAGADLDWAAIEAADDAEVAKQLLPINGIGPWTVQMFLMFGLGRPDVLPVGDLGLRVGVQELFGLTTVPTAKDLEALAQPWRPYRTVATWYVWRSRDTAPKA